MSETMSDLFSHSHWPHLSTNKASHMRGLGGDVMEAVPVQKGPGLHVQLEVVRLRETHPNPPPEDADINEPSVLLWGHWTSAWAGWDTARVTTDPICPGLRRFLGHGAFGFTMGQF